MKLSAITPRRVIKTPTGYTAHYGKAYLGTFGSGKLASAAAQGAENFKKYLDEQKVAKKELRERRIQTPKSLIPETLPKGIYKKGQRYVVGSPYYMGSFETLGEAIAAQSAAPRTYKTKTDQRSIPFEQRILTLED